MVLSGERLRTERRRRLMSQQDLADKAGTSEATVNRLENGLQQARFSTIRRLAEALDVQPGTLLEPEEATKSGDGS
jgi:transcriptional regulator with XRE-family HTH domain